jgi:hypothetical protein
MSTGLDLDWCLVLQIRDNPNPNPNLGVTDGDLVGTPVGLGLGTVVGDDDGCFESVGETDGATNTSSLPPQIQHTSSMALPAYTRPANLMQ